MHVEKMADTNNENVESWVCGIHQVFLSVPAFVCLVHCPDCNSQQFSREKQMIPQIHIFYNFIMF